MKRVQRPSIVHRQPERPNARRGEQPIIGRAALDANLPTVKIIASVIGWGNSAITTIALAMELELLLKGRRSLVGAALGVAVALFLTVGQIFSSGRHRGAYIAFLLPDGVITAVQWCRWLFLPLVSLVLPPATAIISAAILAAWIGLISARAPERLIFGAAQRPRRSYA